MHEVSIRKCGKITQSLCRFVKEVFELLTYEAFPDFPEFLAEFKDKVSEPQRLLALDEALKATPTRWWETHKKSIDRCSLCCRLMEVHFSDTKSYQREKYDGRNDPNYHLMACHTMWVSWVKDEWVHDFVHTLDEMSRQWYVSAELRREITTWEDLTICFSYTFNFADTNPVIHSALQHICDVVLEINPVAYPT